MRRSVNMRRNAMASLRAVLSLLFVCCFITSSSSTTTTSSTTTVSAFVIPLLTKSQKLATSSYSLCEHGLNQQLQQHDRDTAISFKRALVSSSQSTASKLWMASKSETTTTATTTTLPESTTTTKTKVPEKILLTTEEELNDYFDETSSYAKLFSKSNGSTSSSTTSATTNTIDYAARLKAAYVEGDTQMIGAQVNDTESATTPTKTTTTTTTTIHSVVQLLHQRRRQQQQQQQNAPALQSDDSTTGSSNATTNSNNTTTTSSTVVSLDKEAVEEKDIRVALCIEGGGMRGCLSAGMVAAIYYLGLQDTIDVIYGSSAGGVIGSYFVTRQLQWYGPEIYYDSLTKHVAGKDFIDSNRILRAIGLGLLNPKLWKDVMIRRSFGKPVLNLDYLLKRTLQETKPLDWDLFQQRQKHQPIKIVASNLRDEKAHVMSMENGSFSSLSELAQCMHASCLLPGIAGPLMNKYETSGTMMVGNGYNKKKNEGGGSDNDRQNDDDRIPLADALLYEPIPFESALKEGATHVVCLRTRPDGTDVTGKSSFLEKLLLKRFFQRKNALPKIYHYMTAGLHKKRYAEQVLKLNKFAREGMRSLTSDSSSSNDATITTATSGPQVMTIAVPPGSPEVERLETSRDVIFDGVRRGFARAYDCLVEDPKERGRGHQVAREYFPDEILDYDPDAIAVMTAAAAANMHLENIDGHKIDENKLSAFELYLKDIGENPDEWKKTNQY